MRTFKGIKIGGMQHKVFKLVLVFLILLAGTYAAVTVWHQNNLSEIVGRTGEEQQKAIADVSESSMKSVLDVSMTRITALQAYIADDLFGELRSDVLTLRSFAETLFNNSESVAPRTVPYPSKENEGIPSVQLIHELDSDPEHSKLLGIASNMSDIMLAVYGNSANMTSCFIGTADGNMILVNKRPGVFLADDGEVLTLDVRSRPWYTQASAAGELVFTGIETDAYTDNPMIECAAPVYCNGELVAVVAADIYLTSISDYVESTAGDSGFVCVINGNGQMLFSPVQNGFFRSQLTPDAPDLRESGNSDFAAFIAKALKEKTGVETITVEDKEYYMCASPMPSLGWTVVSVVDVEATRQPTVAMIDRYGEISASAMEAYRTGARHSIQTLVILTVSVILIAVAAALVLSGRMVKPIESMTKRINELGESDERFTMDDSYRTGDEIEILAESFAAMSGRAAEYVEKITEITAEKERIGTELALATRIQADMLPNIYPAFPDRREFDIFASMDPAKEVGGDFYDFFLVDDDHLCMVMADVSGKGVPAALFMMASKIILANNAMSGKSPAQILTDTNAAICSNNRVEMFVTVWLGILEISTGRLTAANAGHEYPVVKHPDGSFGLYKDKHGFVVGGMDGVRYREYEMKLEPGSRLFLYTDGVPEATDAEGKMFGTDRMIAALNAAEGDSKQTVGQVGKAVEDFVDHAEQFDDITMLCLEYFGEERSGV